MAYMAQMKGEHQGQELIGRTNEDSTFDMHSLFCAKIFGQKIFGYDTSTPAGLDAAYSFILANKDLIPLVKQHRDITKSCVFGTLYGQTAYGLAYLISIPVPEAEAIIADFFKADPGIQAYVNWSRKQVRIKGYINTIFGRRRRFPLAKIDRKKLARSMRQGCNF